MGLLSAVTLNIESYQLIIAIIIMLGGVFGQPYIVRATNRKKLEEKASTEVVKELANKVDCKADKTFVIKEIGRVEDDVKELKNDIKPQIATIQSDIKKILTLMIDKKK